MLRIPNTIAMRDGGETRCYRVEYDLAICIM